MQFNEYLGIIIFFDLITFLVGSFLLQLLYIFTISMMASNDHPKFKATALAATAFKPEGTPFPLAAPHKRVKRKRSRDKVQFNLEVFRNLSSEEEVKPPHELAAVGNLDDLKTLIELGLSIKEVDNDNSTLLHVATAHNQIHIMQYAIESGININAKDRNGNTALHIATENAHIDAIHLLLNSGADDEILNSKLDAPLHIAFRSNDTNLVAAFLEHPIELVIVGYRKRTPLHVIAEHDNIEACEVLHNSILVKEEFKKKGGTGFRLCAMDEDNLTPIHLAARVGSHRVLDFMISKCKEHGYPVEVVLSFLDEENSTPLHAAVDGGHTDVVQVLLNHGANPTVCRDDQPPPIHLACSQGKLEMIEGMVQQKGKEILQCCDQYGQSLLHRSSHTINCCRMIPYLVDNGVNVDSVDNQGRTPLHTSIIAGSLTAVKGLISHGANPFLKDHQGYNCLHHAVIRNRKAILCCLLELPSASQLVTDTNEKGNTPIHEALSLGFSELVSPMISVIRLHLQNCKDAMGNNYLHLAALSGDWKALSSLLDLPACQPLLNETNKYGETPLHMAAGAGNLRCVEILLGQGAMVHKCFLGHTPFMYACFHGKVDCAKALYEAHPFQKDWTDDEGNTALHMAVQSGNSCAVKLALDVGVEVTHNFEQESFFDVIIDKTDTKCALVVVNHDRWQECLDLKSPCHLHPMVGLIVHMPDVAKAVLDRCRTKASLDSEHLEYWEKFDFKYLRLKSDPLEDDEEDTSTESESLMTSQMHSPVIRYKGSWHKKTGPPPGVRRGEKLPHMEALRMMVKYRRRSLLTHPVVENFLKLKWRNYGRWVYLVSVFLFTIQVFLLSAFIINAPAPFETNTQSVNTSTNSTGTDSDISKGVEVLRAITYLFCILNTISWVLSSISLGMDALNFIKNTFVWIDGLALVTTTIGLIPIRGANSAIWEALALASFFSWFGLVLKIQLFDLFGVYVTMFLAITRTVFQVLLICVFFIVAFGLSLYILAGNLTLFSGLGYSLFTNFGHMLGEIDYAAIVRESSRGNLPFGTLTFLFIVTLAILMAIVIVNLLIGLAVGDIENIRMNAIVEKRSIEVEVYTRLDSNLPKKVIKRFDKPSYTKYPNATVSLVRRFWRFFWRSIKGDDPASGDQGDTEKSTTIEQQRNELALVKQQLDDLTVNQEKLLSMVRQLVGAQQSKEGTNNPLSVSLGE